MDERARKRGNREVTENMFEHFTVRLKQGETNIEMP
jgi:hypothetical protein